MISETKIPLHRMILSLSEALDHVHPRVVDHQRRVAYIAVSMAREIGVSQKDLLDIFLAASLHDIGLIRVENKLLAADINTLEDLNWHGETGFEVLRTNALLADAAAIVRDHHAAWDWGHAEERAGRVVPFGSYVISLADFVERAIDRAAPILDQSQHIVKQVTSLAGVRFHTGCVEAFQTVARPEAFWLDCVSRRVYGLLPSEVEGPALPVTDVSIQQIAQIFGRVVDAKSRWTATHTCAVAASSATLCQLLNFSPREQAYMHTASWLHDLGKLVVPNSILDHPGKFTAREWAVMKTHSYHTFRALQMIGGPEAISEWAAFHHERLDGRGYPFRHKADDLTLGSRVMAAADTFSATAEDRPYREAMSKHQVLSTLDEMTSDGGLDGDVVAVMRKNYDHIEGVRRREIARYAQEQQQLAMIASCATATASA